MMERIAEASPRLKAKIAGIFYLLTFLTGGVALFARGRLGFAAGLIAGACYIAVTLLMLYWLWRVRVSPAYTVAAGSPPPVFVCSPGNPRFYSPASIVASSSACGG